MIAGIIARHFLMEREYSLMPDSFRHPCPRFETCSMIRIPCAKLSDYRGKNVFFIFIRKMIRQVALKKPAISVMIILPYEKAAGVVILGVSPDSVESHVKFKKKFQLQFPLLADDGTWSLRSVWRLGTQESSWANRYEGVLRTTFSDRSRRAISRKVYEDVRPAEHSRELLAEFGLELKRLAYQNLGG
jgi:peroxiredoxin Q/BCP